MRPIDRGKAPQIYTKYQDAQADLIERIGYYCSYCERYIKTNLAVEHIQPKSLVPILRNDWSNFLLSCVNCNSCKGDKNIDITKFFWPHADNTFLAFDYLEAGIVVTHPNLHAAAAAKAQATIELLGLDRDHGQPNKSKWPTSKDIRWQDRFENWSLATHELKRLKGDDTTNVRELIVGVAISRGLFSIWMKVFEDDLDMCCRLIKAFKGTAINCFSSEGKAISRTGGML